MKNWSTLGVTNVLLLIIAIFLLILVIDSSPRSRNNPHAGLSQMGPVPTSPHGNVPMNPHADESQMGDDTLQNAAPSPNSEFNFQNMAFAALKCPTDATISLADATCQGPEAKKIRDYVGELTSQNLPPRMLFDKIIERFGESVLTDEALEIRKNNRSNK